MEYKNALVIRRTESYGESIWTVGVLWKWNVDLKKGYSATWGIWNVDGGDDESIMDRT